MLEKCSSAPFRSCLAPSARLRVSYFWCLASQPLPWIPACFADAPAAAIRGAGRKKTPMAFEEPQWHKETNGERFHCVSVVTTRGRIEEWMLIIKKPWRGLARLMHLAPRPARPRAARLKLLTLQEGTMERLRATAELQQVDGARDSTSMAPSAALRSGTTSALLLPTVPIKTSCRRSSLLFMSTSMYSWRFVVCTCAFIRLEKPMALLSARSWQN